MVTSTGDALTGGATPVAVYDGNLSAEHAAFFGRGPPALLLALREDGAPSAWESKLLGMLLRGDPWPTNERWRVEGLEGLKNACLRAEEVAAGAGAKTNAARVASDVMHELCANALLDAPADPG